MDANESLLKLSPSQLRKAADLKDRIDGLMKDLAEILDGSGKRSGGNEVGNGRPAKRKMSAAGRRRIAAAARARWARVKAERETERMRSARMAIFTEQPAATAPTPKKRSMSAAARGKIAAGARARWAKFRAAKKA
jgi:hypothetical protein